MPLRSRLPLCLLLLLGLAGPAEARRVEPTIGLVTHEAEFHEALREVDPWITRLVEAREEDEARRIGREIAEALGETQYLECLLRYRHRALRHVLLPLLRSTRWAVRSRALYALKHVGGAEEGPAVAALLRDRDPRVRDVAATTLAHLLDEVPAALTKAHARERSRFARAGMKAALRVLAGAEKPYRPWRERLVGPERARRVDWSWNIVDRAGMLRTELRDLPYPEASSFDWPVSWYHGSHFLRTPRRSFGAGNRHVGEDMAWYRDGCSVFSTADGLVRLVQDAGGDWGFLVVIEHRLPNGAYTCAVYGHLGADVLVQPGDVVSKNQMIGTVGLSCSVANGGYGAHLHFGLADGPFRRPPDLVTGSRLPTAATTPDAEDGVVTRLGYDPHARSTAGLAALVAVVRMPDLTTRVAPLGSPPLQDQIEWIRGYERGLAGWHDPHAFIRARRAAPAR